MRIAWICRLCGVLLALSAVTAIPACAQGPIVATVGGRQILSTELDDLIGDRLLRLKTDEYAAKLAVLKERMDRILLALEAERRGVVTAELLDAEVNNRVTPVTEAEAQAVIDTLPQTSGPRLGVGAVRAAMEDIKRKRLAKRHSEFLATLRQQFATEVRLQQPRLIRPIDGGQTKGPASAPVSIVVFSDFQCPYCTALEASLLRLEAEYAPRVRITAKQFPLPNHAQAMKASEAALCAAEQSGYWRMQDALFANQGLVAGQQFSELAKRVGLDISLFENCMSTQRSAKAVATDIADGRAVGVGSTPTLFINGLMVIGAKPYEALRDLIRSEINRSAGVDR